MDKGLCIIPLYDFRLDVAKKVLLGKKCVGARIREKHGRILYLVLYNGK